MKKAKAKAKAKSKRPVLKSKPVRKAPPPKAPPRKPQADPGPDFARALDFASRDYLVDAIAHFRKALDADPAGPLADDACANAGLCYLRLGLFEEALKYFTRAAADYPKATIHATVGAHESGRTAAKARLGRVHCFLRLGKRDDAQRELDELNMLPESHVVDASGARRTFYELALEAMQ